MKKLIALLIVLMFVTTSYAEDFTEEVVCAPNKAGGAIYLRKNMTVIGSSSLEPDARYISGYWELVGESLVMITWDDKTHTVLPKSAFMSCNL